MCEAHQADAFERFFAHGALGRAWLAGGDRPAAAGVLTRMQALVAGIDEAADRAWAERTLRELRASVEAV